VPFFSNSDAQVLVRDITSGDVGITETIPTRLMLIQSADLQAYAINSGDSPVDGITFNSGGVDNARAVLWKSDEIGTNNLLDEQTHASGVPFEYFIIKAKGLYEVSGFMLYEPNCQYNSNVADLDAVIEEINNEAYAAVNVAIQRQEAGETTWENIAATRVIWSGRAIYGTANSATVPPVTVLFNAGDKIRLVFYRPNNTLGRPHGRGGEWGITYVTGIDVKKGLRVTLIEEQQ
jgi:hypothetical protein